MFIIISVLAFVAVMAIIINKASKKPVNNVGEALVHKKDCGCDGNCACGNEKKTVSYPLVSEPSITPVPTFVEISAEEPKSEAVIIEPVIEPTKDEAPAAPEKKEKKKPGPKPGSKKPAAKPTKPTKKPAAKKPTNKGKKK